jgi:hypothetical protein
MLALLGLLALLVLLISPVLLALLVLAARYPPRPQLRRQPTLALALTIAPVRAHAPLLALPRLLLCCAYRRCARCICRHCA